MSPPQLDTITSADKLVTRLRDGAAVLTANQRLGRFIRNLYDQAQLRRGAKAWHSPLILPLESWCEAFWQQRVDSAPTGHAQYPLRRLSAYQEQLLWEHILAADPRTEGFIQHAETAAKARAAWRLARQWNLALGDIAGPLNEDSRALLDWASRYQKQCRNRDWLDTVDIMSQVIDWLRDGESVPSKEILLAGFDEFTPQQRSLIDALQSSGTAVKLYAAAPPDVVVAKLALQDREDELRTAARWARALVETHPRCSVGIVVPALQALRSRVQSVLENVFQPGDVDHEGDSVAPFNVSLGTRLSEQPVVNDMFLALEWLGGQLVWDKFSELIRSPFLAAAEQELAGRALLDARLRQLGEPVITFEVLEAFLGQDGCADWMAAQCPCLQQMFIDVMAQRDVFAAPNRPQAWLKKIEQLSRLIGWPGQRTPDSQEYQVLAAWQRMLETFAGARVVERALSLRELLSHLRQLAADTVFQGKSPGTPVQVVGLLEAGGMVFDYLWVMDLHDETLPAAPAPNPFLPVALQRRLNMPHASAERELSFARNVIQRLATSGGQVVMSYPLREQDRELTPSPLLSEFPDISIAELDIYPHDYRQSIFQSKALESWRDDQGPALKPQGEVRGGTRLFQYQAACPFLAFATFRLDAEPLANVDVGVDPMTRGIILHAVLEKVWRRLGDRQTLVAMDTEQRIQLVTSCIDDVILPYLDERPVTFSNRFVSLEKRRLANLVLEWLALEEQREAFVVEQTESPQTVTIDSLQVRTKIDRIDKLPDGSRVILDYKTGDASVKDWFGARPDAPQLPLYAVSAEPPPVAVAFASVRTGKCGFTGLSKFSDTLPRVKRFSDSEYCYGDADWSAMLDEWRRSLQGLAQEILQGDARVAPKSGSSCRYCQLQPLCRIDELQTAQKPGPDNDG